MAADPILFVFLPMGYYYNSLFEFNLCHPFDLGAICRVKIMDYAIHRLCFTRINYLENYCFIYNGNHSSSWDRLLRSFGA